jgi:predicted nucleic acid-binding protein
VLFPDLLPVTRDDILEACNLIRRYPRLPVRDAVRAATMTRNGIRRIIRVDTDFDAIAGIRRLDPTSV